MHCNRCNSSCNERTCAYNWTFEFSRESSSISLFVFIIKSDADVDSDSESADDDDMYTMNETKKYKKYKKYNIIYYYDKEIKIKYIVIVNKNIFNRIIYN